jgi:hypothetical protein
VLPEGQSSGVVVAGWLPPGARLAMAFGSMSAGLFLSAANRSPELAALFYAADDRRKPGCAHTWLDFSNLPATSGPVDKLSTNLSLHLSPRLYVQTRARERQRHLDRQSRNPARFRPAVPPSRSRPLRADAREGRDDGTIAHRGRDGVCARARARREGAYTRRREDRAQVPCTITVRDCPRPRPRRVCVLHVQARGPWTKPWTIAHSDHIGENERERERRVCPIRVGARPVRVRVRITFRDRSKVPLSRASARIGAAWNFGTFAEATARTIAIGNLL